MQLWSLQATQTSPCLDAKGNLWYALDKGDTLGQFHLDHISRQVQVYRLGANQVSDWESLGNGDLGDPTSVRCYSQGTNPRAGGGVQTPQHRTQGPGWLVTDGGPGASSRVDHPGWMAPAGRQVRALTKRPYLGTQLGLEPSTSQVAKRFMGTGVLSAAGAPARPRRPRSAMAPAPRSSAAWGYGRAADAQRRRRRAAGGPGARRAAARSHGGRAVGTAGRAADRPAGGDEAAAAPPRAARPRPARPSRAPRAPDS